jgi:hypothetical protein
MKASKPNLWKTPSQTFVSLPVGGWLIMPTSIVPACFREILRAKAGEDRERRLWQPTRHPVQIETERFWQVKIDYLHANPCRKGLVVQPDHWRFSSAAAWTRGELERSEVVLSPVFW